MRHELIAKRSTVADEHPQFAAIAIGIPLDRPLFKWPGVHERLHPKRRLFAALGFLCAAGRMRLGRINVGDAHLM